MTEPKTVRTRLYRYGMLALVVAIYLGVSITLASTQADTLIDLIGSDNVYLLMFVLGIIGGLTTFTGVPYHLVLMSLAAGGLSPVLLGICTAMGVMLGDSTMFLIGRNVKAALSDRVMATVDHLTSFLTKRPRMVTPALVAYGAVSPFSNDFIVASLSIMGYSFWRTVIPLAIGNTFYNIAFAYFGLYAYDAILEFF